MKRLLLCVAVIAMGIAWHPASSAAGEDEEGRFKFGGSMRGRFEFFRFSEDETGTKRNTRGRFRYRFRLDGKILINSRANFQFRLISGENSRSGNQTIGSPVDFGPNIISIRSAMMVLTPWPDGKLPNNKGYWKFDFGRVSNPYVFKQHCKDMMLWDHDLAFGGMGTQFGYQLGGKSTFLFNTGYYQIDENSSDPVDPYLAPVQVGLVYDGDRTKMGIRASYWYMAELDSAFIQRGVDGEGGVTPSAGNIPDGLTGSVYGGTLRVVSAQAYIRRMLGSVPVSLYGGYSTNLSAEPSKLYPGIGKNANAWNAGLEGGSKDKFMLVGMGIIYLEANAFPSQFVDSDFLDGITNRYGPILYLSKQLFKRTDFNTQLFWSDGIESNNEGYYESLLASERVRLQVDVLYHF